MLPDPLHPAVVHLPIALAILMPLLAILAIVSIRKQLLPERSWLAVVLLQALLVGSAWLALETGEDQEERVEKVVAERHIEAHAQAAERFLVVAGLGLLASVAGLLPGERGFAGRAAALVLTLGALGASVAVGRAGGELVYVHGAANAYLGAAGTGGAPELARSAEHDD